MQEEEVTFYQKTHCQTNKQIMTYTNTSINYRKSSMIFSSAANQSSLEPSSQSRQLLVKSRQFFETLGCKEFNFQSICVQALTCMTCAQGPRISEILIQVVGRPSLLPRLLMLWPGSDCFVYRPIQWHVYCKISLGAHLTAWYVFCIPRHGITLSCFYLVYRICLFAFRGPIQCDTKNSGNSWNSMQIITSMSRDFHVITVGHSRLGSVGVAHVHDIVP